MTILSKNRNHGRQYPLVAQQSFALSELTSGSGIGAVKLPAGARVIGGGLLVTEVFNSTTSDTIKVGDGGDDDRYTASAVNVQALGYTALTITGYKYTATDYVDLKWTSGGGTPSTGAGILFVNYVIDGRANEVNPDYD